MRSAYAYHREVENSYLVRERDRRRWRELGRVVAVALPVALALVVYIWLHLVVLDTAYAIGGLEATLAGLERTAAQLDLEADRLSALPEVERRASEELGMVGPEVAATEFWDGADFGGGSGEPAAALRRPTAAAEPSGALAPPADAATTPAPTLSPAAPPETVP